MGWKVDQFVYFSIIFPAFLMKQHNKQDSLKWWKHNVNVNLKIQGELGWEKHG